MKWRKNSVKIARKLRGKGAEMARKWQDCNILSWTETSQPSPPSNIEVPEEQTGCYSYLEGDIKVEDTQTQESRPAFIVPVSLNLP